MKRRLLLSYLSITAFALLVLEIPLGVTYAGSVERRITGELQHDAFALSIRAQQPLSRAGEGPAAVAELQRVADGYGRGSGARVVVVDDRGQTIVDSDHAAPLGRAFGRRPEIQAALGGAEVSGTRSSRTLGHDVLFVALPVGAATGIRGAVRLTVPASIVSDQIRHIWLLLAATGGVVLGIVFLVSLLLARSVARPLGELQEAAVQLGSGDLAVRATAPRGPSEVRVLAESFNATAARLEQLVDAQRGFIADASHQLRTPLAALRLRLENVEADVDAGAVEDIEGALTEVGRLSRLVDALLALARAEQSPSTVESIAVDALVDGRCEAWEAFATERRVRIDQEIEGAPVALATPGRLEQVVDNLLNNALEVAPPGSTVRLVASSRTDWVEVRVTDQGPGMTAEERARAFERFWQSGEARRAGRPNGHFGLGLAIVRELVVGDGGTVLLEEAEGGGLAVVIRLRRADVPGRPRQLSLAATA